MQCWYAPPGWRRSVIVSHREIECYAEKADETDRADRDSQCVFCDLLHVFAAQRHASEADRKVIVGQED